MTQVAAGGKLPSLSPKILKFLNFFLEVPKIFDNVFGVLGVALSEYNNFNFFEPVFKIVFVPGSPPSYKASFIYSHSQGVPLISSEPPFESLDLIGL